MPEKIIGVRLSEYEQSYALVIYLENGGASLDIDKKTDSQTIANALRYFARVIEESVSKREGAKEARTIPFVSRETPFRIWANSLENIEPEEV